jgi:N-acetylglucosamine-6-phosphate deacetylase
VTIQFIGDGLHVSDDMMHVAFAAAPGRCVVVTDAIAATASDQSVVQLGDVTVYVKDGIARRDDGTIAGSVGTLRDSLARLSTLGLSPALALSAVISHPATFLGAQSLVAMTPGSPANLFVVDDDLVMTQRVTPDGVVDL